MGIDNKLKNYEKKEKINENQKNESVNGNKKQLKEIEDYLTEYVNRLLNNAKFKKVQEPPMAEVTHDVYYFLRDYLPNEIKIKIDEVSICQDYPDSIDHYSLIKIIIDVSLVQLKKKLLIEENKFDAKSFVDIVKKIVLNLVDNAKSDGGGIYIIQNKSNKIDDFADAKLVIDNEKSQFKISDNEIKNDEKNDHRNKNKETEYTAEDHAQAKKLAKFFNKENRIYHSNYFD